MVSGSSIALSSTKKALNKIPHIHKHFFPTLKCFLANTLMDGLESNLWFSILHKHTACTLEQAGIEQSIFQLVDGLL